MLQKGFVDILGSYWLPVVSRLSRLPVMNMKENLLAKIQFLFWNILVYVSDILIFVVKDVSK